MVAIPTSEVEMRTLIIEVAQPSIEGVAQSLGREKDAQTSAWMASRAT